ncbi:hypothetical protein JCM16303_005785 [Sporobolomyces ruberrimus]
MSSSGDKKIIPVFSHDFQHDQAPPRSEEEAIAQAGVHARTQVDAEVAQAKKSMNDLLNEIMTRRSRKNPTKHKFTENYLNFDDPGEHFECDTEDSWRRAIRASLEVLKGSMEESKDLILGRVTPLKEVKQSKSDERVRQAAEKKLHEWSGAVEKDVLEYFDGEDNKHVAGMQILYEIARLAELFKKNQPPLLKGWHEAGERLLVTPCYHWEKVLERIKAWAVNPLYSLSKRLIGRRTAEIEGVPYFENENGETCF